TMPGREFQGTLADTSPHPEEAPLGAVSKDGDKHIMVRDARGGGASAPPQSALLTMRAEFNAVWK
ncbi:hypothetical protein, partial [Tardiphaga sp.]|uniref:hypothetical protein n=1 Tax=Tardiphaga sp. TaxID=1926292 RepID=UPI00352A2C27